jgi:cyclopropane-fatty-acyl-phospholipid synthase
MTTTASESSYAGASKQAIGHHYDVDSQFYRLWLDETITYSCALWADDDESLEAAQLRKLDYMIDAAAARDAERVLDIGCGWGGMLRRLVEHAGVSHATGLTLSESQARWARDTLPSNCEVRVENWADHQPDRPYDAIISIGAFEHFARYGLRRDERISSYRRFFMHCRDILPPGGRLSLQTNVKGNNVRLNRQTIGELRFICTTIFPESELPWFSEVVLASEKTFDIIEARNDPMHYARTCQHWYDNLRANRAQAVELVGEDKVADYERYLSSTVRHFEARHLGLARFTFVRI